MQTRKAQIEQIILNRQFSIKKAQDEQIKLEKTNYVLEEFSSFVTHFASSLEEQKRQQVLTLLPQIQEIKDRLSKLRLPIERLVCRFSRNTINIGIVGQARQGKSTFLQRLTGLSDGEIPTGNAGHCTGAPSFIIHENVDAPFAELVYYTPGEFLRDIISPYFSELSLPVPLSLENFSNVHLPEEKNYANDATLQEKLKKIRALQTAYPEFKNYLGASKRRVEQAEIRDCIAQRDSKGMLIYQWYSIKQANVHCRFPQEDIASIKVGDTPGLGDFVSGAEETLARNVGNEMDLILFLRRPDIHDIEPQDTVLYNLIQRSVSGISPDQWTYFIVNSSDGENGGHFYSQLANSSLKTRQQYLINALKEDEVAKCMDGILTDAIVQLPQIDERLLSNVREGYLKLKESILELYRFADAILPGKRSIVSSYTDSTGESYKMGLRAYEDMAKNLDQLIKKYGDDVEENVSTVIDDVMEEIWENMQRSAAKNPSDDIVSAVGLTSWMQQGFSLLQVEFLSHFEALDQVMFSQFEELRNEVMLILKENGNLNSFINSDSPWDSLKECCFETLGEESSWMNRAISRLLEANLTFRGLILPRILQIMDIFDADKPANTAYAFKAGDSLDKCKEKLQTAWEDVVNNTKNKIKGMGVSTEPTKALFSTLKEFRLIWLNGEGQREAQGRWIRFYQKNCGEIWPDVFEQLEENSRLRKQWMEKILTLKELGNNF